MKWANNYDKSAFRAAYLSNSQAGTGAQSDTTQTDVPAPASTAPLPPSTSKTGPPSPPPKEAVAVATPLPPSPEPLRKEVKEPLPEEKKDTPKSTKTVVMEDPASPELEAAEETNKKSKKKTSNTGFKSMFGTNKKKAEQPSMKSTGAKESSSVAAARAALEAKAKAAQDPSSVSPQKPSVVKKKPVPERPVTVEGPTEEPTKPSTPQQPEEPVPGQNVSTQIVGSGSPPKTRRAVEYDALSRVGTNERNAADQEFSKFDQGPLIEQPALIPEDPSATTAPPPYAEQPQTLTNSQGPKLEGATELEETEVATSRDRWAQIRKNAAERAAIATEEPETRTSQSERTDEGDTSGEESTLETP